MNTEEVLWKINKNKMNTKKTVFPAHIKTNY